MESSLTPARIRRLIEAFKGRRILVLGDMMLDAFIWGKVRRISPEAPVPVVEVLNETYLLGGAGNVAANIQELGGVPVPVGIIGEDAEAGRVLELLSSNGIDTAGLLPDRTRPTTVKTRIVAHSQQIVRTDRESRVNLSAEHNQALAGAFTQLLASVSAVILSDYDKGVVNRDLLGQILPEAQRMGIPVFLDPKVHHADYYRPVTLIKPNHREAELLAGMAIDNSDQLEEAGQRLLEKFECRYVLITRGEEGMTLFERGRSLHLPTAARKIFDVTGAGDTVIATLAIAHAGGATIEEAAILANHAAGLVVGKVGTATVNRAELLTDFDSRDAHPAS